MTPKQQDERGRVPMYNSDTSCQEEFFNRCSQSFDSKTMDQIWSLWVSSGLEAALSARLEAQGGVAKDAARLDFIDNAASEGVIEFGIELDGGVFMQVCQMGGVEINVREKNTIRDAIDAAITTDAEAKP